MELTHSRPEQATSQMTLQSHSQQAIALQARYPILTYQSDKFAKVFGADYPVKISLKIDSIAQAHGGVTPTLAATSQVYGVDMTSAILSAWLKTLNDFVGKGELSALQIEETSILMIKSAWWLKLGELAYFIQGVKSGDYGKLYGNLSPLWIMEQLQTFKSLRMAELDRAQKDKEAREREENKRRWEQEAATPEQVRAIMAQFSGPELNLVNMITHD